MDIAWRIKELIAQSGLSQAEVAKKAGFSQQYISAVANGKKIPLDNLERLCISLNATLPEFFSPFSKDISVVPKYLQEFTTICSELPYEDIQALTITARRMKAIREEALRNTTPISSPVISANEEDEDWHGDVIWKEILGDAAAGYEGVYRPADNGDRILVPKRYASSDYYVIRAYGKSMEPRIHNGGCVVVHRNMPPSNGDLALIRKHGVADHELMIKKYFKEDKIIRLVSANPEFDDIRLEPKCIALCERVVYIVRDKSQTKKPKNAPEE